MQVNAFLIIICIVLIMTTTNIRAIKIYFGLSIITFEKPEVQANINKRADCD